MSVNCLFEQTRIGSCQIKNRFAMAPLGPLGMSDSEGGWSHRGMDYYVARAKGGVGLIHTGIVFVENQIEQHAVGNCPCATQNPAHFIRTSHEMTERIHAYGCKIFLQLTAGFGRVSVPKAWGIFPPVAPSEIQHRWKDVLCRALTVDEIHLLVEKFGESAYYTKTAGFDGIQIHAVHEGYLLDQFSMSLFNRRTDEYGGSLENRLRIVREIREEIEKKCGPDFPVSIRFSPKSFIKELREGALPGEVFTEKGRDLPEGLTIAQQLERFGYDALDVDVGSYDAWWWSHPPMYQEKGLYLPYCQAVKEVVQLPILCAGRMDDPTLAENAVKQGSCDIISLGRPLLADPDYVKKLKEGRTDAIRPCISCQEGCMGRVQNYSQLNCAVNPQCGRESDLKIVSAAKPKRVLIVGGGPAGCEAARILAMRGHKPVLYEKEAQLGGNLIAGGTPDFKRDDLLLAAWYHHELKRLGVEVYLNTYVDEAVLKRERPEAVIFATGSTARHLPELKDNVMVCSAKDALLGNREIGDKVYVVGGGTVSCEVALWCRQKGKNVTIVVRGDGILKRNHPSCSANSEMLKRLIEFHRIPVLTRTCVENAAEGNVTLADLEQNIRIEQKADSVILAIGYEPERELYQRWKDFLCEAYVIGDARRVSNIMYAIWDAYELACNL